MYWSYLLTGAWQQKHACLLQLEVQGPSKLCIEAQKAIWCSINFQGYAKDKWKMASFLQNNRVSCAVIILRVYGREARQEY